MDARDDLVLTLAELRGHLDPADAAELRESGTPASARLPRPLHESLARIADAVLARGGKLLAGRYDLLRKLGEGGMGKVYLARDLKLDRVVAIKGLGRSDPDDLERFSREARLAAGLRHPNLVEVFDIVADGPNHFISMRYVDGRPLSELCTERTRPLPALVEALAQAAEGLEHAHAAGIVHRDVKPANILVDATDRASLTDFGLARRLDGATRVTKSGVVLGTPAYMAPEQAQGDPRRVDARSDVYGLGASLYEVLTGRPPFDGDSVIEVLGAVVRDDPVPPRRLAPRAPRDLELVCLKAIDKDPGLRYATAGEFAAELRRWLAREPVLAAPPSAARRLRRWISRHRVLSVAAAALLLLAGAGALLLKGSARAERDRRTIERGARYRKLQERLNPVAGIIKETRLLYYIPNVDLPSRIRKVEEALEELQRLAREAEEEEGADAEPWILAGMGWYFVGDIPRAEAALQRAATLAPADGRVPYYLGRIGLERSMAAAFEPERAGSRRAGRKAWSEQARRLFERAAPAEDVDRDIAAAYLALARDRHDEVAKLCAEGRRRHADALGSEEFSLLEALVLADPAARLEAAGRALQRRPHYAWGYFVRGNLESDRGRLPAAIEDLTRAIAVNPRMATAYANRAAYRQWSGDTAGAAEDFERAVALDPANARVYYNRGGYRRLRGELDAAIADFGKAIELDPGHIDSYNNRAMARRARREYDAALADSQKAIDLDPREPVSWLVRAATYLALGRRAEAKADIDEALKVEPGNPEAYSSLGNLHAMEGRRREAIDAYTKAIDSGRAMPGSYVNRGTLRSELGDHDGAIRDYDEALKLDVAYLAAWTNRGNVKWTKGDPQGALADFAEALKINPASVETLNARAAVRLSIGDLPGAREDCDAAIAADPKFPGAWINRGAVRDQAGDKAGALADYDRGLELNPNDAAGHYNRGLLKMEGKDAAGAMADFDRAISLRPRYPNALFARASLHYSRKDLKASLADVEAALECAPPNWSRRRSAESSRDQLRKMLR